MVDGLDKDVQHKLTSLVSTWIFCLPEYQTLHFPLCKNTQNSSHHRHVSYCAVPIINVKFQCHDFVEDHEEEALPIFKEGGAKDEHENKVCTELLGLLLIFAVYFMHLTFGNLSLQIEQCLMFLTNILKTLCWFLPRLQCFLTWLNYRHMYRRRNKIPV